MGRGLAGLLALAMILGAVAVVGVILWTIAMFLWALWPPLVFIVGFIVLALGAAAVSAFTAG